MSPIRSWGLVSLLMLVASLGVACRSATKSAPVVTSPDATPPPVASEEAFQPEEPEADPRSDSVSLKVAIFPAVRASVFWGAKRLGEIKPPETTLEFERPRSSGPVDLLIRAEGFLPHHVRLFTDRDDKIGVRLLRSHQVAGLPGARPLAVPGDAGVPDAP